jgi:hypothetical protein
MKIVETVKKFYYFDIYENFYKTSDENSNDNFLKLQTLSRHTQYSLACQILYIIFNIVICSMNLCQREWKLGSLSFGVIISNSILTFIYFKNRENLQFTHRFHIFLILFHSCLWLMLDSLIEI